MMHYLVMQQGEHSPVEATYFASKNEAFTYANKRSTNLATQIWQGNYQYGIFCAIFNGPADWYTPIGREFLIYDESEYDDDED
jgi:hypothetical protein